MRIVLFVGHLGHGGAERDAVSLSGKFAELGHSVTVITFDNPEHDFYSLDHKVNRESLNGLKNSGNFFSAIRNNIRNIELLRKMLRRLNPDIILCLSITTLFVALTASAFLGIIVIGSEKSNPYINDKNGTIWKRLKKIISRYADGFVFQTERSMKFYPKTVQEKGVVIPNAVYVGKEKELQPWNSGSKMICAVGRLSREKGFDNLLKAFTIVTRKAPEYRLVIYGEGPERESLEKLICNFGLQMSVVMPGQIQDIIHKISCAYLFVLSSRYEGMPNSLLEAMAAGLPCISTDCPMGPRELIQNGINGLLVPVDDEKALADAILKLISNPGLAYGLGQKAQSVRQTNSADHIALRYLEYFNRCLKETISHESTR